MEKVKLNAKLISSSDKIDIDVEGIKNKNKILYKEGKVNVTILIFNNRIEMNRTTNEYKINLVFENKSKTISTYNVFGAPKVFTLETLTKKINISDSEIIIEYNLEGNDFYYHLIIGG